MIGVSVFVVAFLFILVASLQDLKRKEVDNWLNLSLMVFSFGVIIFSGIFGNEDFFVFGLVSFFVLFVVMNVFYFGRVFGGGDAKLLWAMFAVFVSASLIMTLANIGFFILVLLMAGSFYGFVYSLILFFMNFKECKKSFRKYFDKTKLYYFLFFGFVFVIFGFYNLTFFIPALLFFIAPVLYAYAKVVEGVALTKKVSAKDLREGDWLAEDVVFGKKVLHSDWDGLSLEDIDFLKKKKKSVRIKEGIPFVPAFLIAFLIYVFLKDYIFGLIF